MGNGYPVLGKLKNDLRKLTDPILAADQHKLENRLESAGEVEWS